MNIIEETLYDFNDILIEPAHMSNIRSRKEVNTKNQEGFLPLMTAPMDTVVGPENFHLFEELGIRPVLPRTPYNLEVSFEKFLSYGLVEFEELFIKNDVTIENGKHVYALIDVANGHMKALYDTAKLAKEKYGEKLVLMIGNVANPKTFVEYCEIGVDYIRIGIGNGGGCLTTVQTGVGFPMASLIEQCYDVKKYMNYPNVKIVADGGFKTYSDVIKALALGADYVMLGSILNKALESTGETTKEDGEVINQYGSNAKDIFNVDLPLYKTFRGMSTKDVQKAWGRDDLKTSEGVVRKHKVEYTLEGWVSNFDSYLRSAMSYTGKKELHDFIGGVQTNFITQNSYNRFNK